MVSIPVAAQAARILELFPFPSISHQVVFRAYTRELACRGHRQLVLTTDPAPTAHPNITQIDVHDITYPIWQQRAMKKILEAKRISSFSIPMQHELILHTFADIMEAQLSLPKIQAQIFGNKEGAFDLILLESYVRPLYAFRHKFKVPLVAVTSCSSYTYTSDSVGIPTHPLYYPDVMGTTRKNSLYQKIYATYVHLYRYYIDMKISNKLNEITRKYFGEDVPSIPELESYTDLLILNVNPIWEGIKVSPPNVIYTWGIHLQPTKDLPKDLAAFLDSSARGVVYMSLGTNAKSSELSAERLHVFLDAFRRLPYDVLWKWEADELPGRPHNVRISKWLPQADLLRHPNVKAFITQGGLQSTEEALRAGVPLVGIPMYGDQEPNVERYEILGVGVKLDLETLTANRLLAAVKSVVDDEKYRAAGRRLARLMSDRDGSVAHAAWWVEYVVRHGGALHMWTVGCRYRAAGQRLAQLMADGDGSVAHAAWWVEFVVRHGGALHMWTVGCRYRAAGQRLARLMADGDGSVAHAAWWVEFVVRHGGALHMWTVGCRYRAAGQRLARLMADGDGSVAHAAWWLEYVVRHGGAQHLRSPAAGVSFAEYCMLDVVAALAFAAAIMLLVILSASYNIYIKFFSPIKLMSYKKPWNC